jgi:HK97 family phage major capsid protein
MPIVNTTQNAYKFILESTFTNNAAEVAESVEGTLATYGEAAIGDTETTADIRKIAVLLPVSDEQLADVPGIRDYLDSRLAYMVRARLEAQIIAGNGSAPNIRGLINVSSINTQAKGGDSVPDAIYKGITLIRVNGQCEPNVILMHPSDWQDVRILSNVTGDYIGNGVHVADTRTLFGIPVILNTAVTSGTAVVLDTMFNTVVMRQGVDIQVTNAHSTWFASGVQAIKAEVRAGLACQRVKSICTVTGI